MNIEKTGFYTFARFVISVILRFIFGIKFDGMENFPKNQNCILIGNHTSAWDPLTIALFYSHNEVHFMAKESLFKNAFLKLILDNLHAFPVRRGETDMGAMRMCMQVLREGHVLGIFPEGHRQKDGRVKHVETGIAVMALKTEVPIIPVFICGRYRPFGRLRAVAGPPIPLGDLRAKHPDVEILEAVKARVIHSLESLRPSTK